MKALATSKRAAILQSLCEGMSVRATSRITGAATNTILDLITKAGEACAAYQDDNLRNLPCDNVQMDELFAFIGCREKNKREGSQHYGDIWTWIAIDSTTKLRITWHTGDRSHRSAFAICQDLAKRIPANAQITSDGLASYKFAIGSTMPEAQFAQLVKVYDKDSQGREIVPRADKMPVFGDPDPSRISTSHVEASNLHMRMQNRRYARLTNAHSKKVRNHNLMLAIGFMAYNFCRKHMTLKKTPAMAAGVTDRVWTMDEVIAMTDRYNEVPNPAALVSAHGWGGSFRKPIEHLRQCPPIPYDIHCWKLITCLRLAYDPLVVSESAPFRIFVIPAILGFRPC